MMHIRLVHAALFIAAIALPPAQAQQPSEPRPLLAQAALLVAGAYAVDGRNPDGTPYRGSVIVHARADGKFEFLWRIGVFQHGIGSVQGSVVTVDFGDAFPAIYQIQTDGSLSGTWADGRASERLTPVGFHRT